MADSKLLKKDDINLLPRTLKDAVKLSDGSSIDENLTEMQNANSILSTTNSNLESIVGNSLQDDITAQCEQLQSTKDLLKQRLTEKGVNVTSENNFYNLADKVGEIQSGGGTSGFIDLGAPEKGSGMLANYTFYVSKPNFNWTTCVFTYVEKTSDEALEDVYTMFFDSDGNPGFYTKNSKFSMTIKSDKLQFSGIIMTFSGEVINGYIGFLS